MTERRSGLHDAEAPHVGRRRNLAGVNLLEAGIGPPLLMLHGIGSSSLSFVHQLEHFSGRWRAMAWDAPGYGHSPDPEEPLGMAGFAHAAAEVIEQLGEGPAHVLGVSFGGVVATRIALDRPDLVRSLVLADSTVGSGQDPTRAIAMRKRPAQLEAQGAAEFARSRAPRLLSDKAPESLVRAVAQEMAQVRLPGYAYAAEAMSETNHTTRLREIDLPTLVLVGAKDEVTPLSQSEILTDGIAKSKLEVVPDAGHLSNRENPEAFNSLVKTFLREHENRP